MRIKMITTAIKRRLKRGLHVKAKKAPDAVRWGIIGLGNMAQVFADALNGNSSSMLVSVASRSTKKANAFARRNGVANSYGSYEEMLADESLKLDVVYIATPVKCHFEHIKMCLSSGKNVLCEKPIVCTSAELEELVSLARQQRCFLMEGMWMKCLPVFRQAKRMISDGMIGKVELIRVDFYKREVVDPKRSIFNKSEGGGVLMDYGIYALAFALDFLGGEPERLRYEVRKNNLGIDTDWSIVMSRGGTRSIVNISSNFNSASKATVVGAEGSIEWDAQFNRTNHIKRFNAQNQLQEEIRIEYDFDGYEYEISHVGECLNKGLKESDVVPLDSSIAALKIVDSLVK